MITNFKANAKLSIKPAVTKRVPLTGVPGNTVASEYGRSKNRIRKR